MIAVYFDMIDKVLSLKMPKLKLFFSLFYFPTLIICYVLAFNYTENHWNLVNYLIISVLIFATPALAVPAIFFLNNKNFFLLRKFANIIDHQKVHEDFEIQIPNEKMQIYFWPPSKIFKTTFALILDEKKEKDSLSSGGTYKPSKMIIRAKKLKLQDFYENSAKEYFEVLDYDLDLLSNLLFNEKVVTKEMAVELFEELHNHEIGVLISRLNKITGTDKKQIALLFKKLNKKSGVVEMINWNSIKSSVSQRNRDFKS